MKNIVIHEKLDNGKTLLLAINRIRVLYDEKVCQFINKDYRKGVISNDKKEIIAFKISKQNPIPLYSKVESDELVSYFYWDIDKQGIHIIISKIEPFAYIKLYGSMHEIQNDVSGEEHLRQAKEILKYALRHARMRANTYKYTLDYPHQTFSCEFCKKEYAITSLEEKKEILECECSAKYEIEYKKVMRAVVKQV